MATNSTPSTKTSKREANAIYRSLSDTTPPEKKPKRSLDRAIDDIYLQAHAHRNRLVTFYIIYTVIFSLFVAGLITFQAAARTVEGKEAIELIPQEALNLLVVGMFGQFISLLTIVTKKVWTFEPFLKHHLDYK
ncbi:MAG: hypothetical protein GY954_03670, partial [Alteromonas sp.]|nr:hypothetical protein [Alteromonas sp.]